MAPKKKVKELPAEVDMVPQDLSITLGQETDILQREIMMYREEALKISAVELELKAKVEEMEKDLVDEKDGTLAVTANMARQYKSLQEQLIAKLNALETILTDYREELDMTEHELEELKQEKQEKINDRDNQIKNLKNKMEKMEKEFATMLQQTCTMMEHSLKDGIFSQNQYDLIGLEGAREESSLVDPNTAPLGQFGKKFDESDKRMRMGGR